MTEGKFGQSLELRITEALVYKCPGLIYDLDAQEFLTYEPSTCTWRIVSEVEIIILVKGFISSHQEFKTRESTKQTFCKNGAEHLRYPAARKVNSVPGIMAFLNYATGCIEQRKPEHYSRICLDQPYDAKKPIDEEVVNFIKNLCNNANLQIQLLRHHFQNILLSWTT